AVALGARRAHARHRLRVAVARLAVLHVALHGWSFGAASTSSGCTDANCVCRVTLRPHFWHLAYFADVTRVAPPHSGHSAPIAIRIDVNTPRCLRFASVKRSLRCIAASRLTDCGTGRWMPQREQNEAVVALDVVRVCEQVGNTNLHPLGADVSTILATEFHHDSLLTHGCRLPALGPPASSPSP